MANFNAIHDCYYHERIEQLHHSIILLFFFLNSVVTAIKSAMAYWQCTPPPPPDYDFFPKTCRSTFDCFPNLCCQEMDKKVCRPPRRSLLTLITNFAQVKKKQAYIRNYGKSENIIGSRFFLLL